MSRHEGRSAVNHRSPLGLGREYARRLASERSRIIIADVAPADRTRQLVGDEGTGALVVACDVPSSESVAELGDPSESGAPMVTVSHPGRPPAPATAVGRPLIAGGQH